MELTVTSPKRPARLRLITLGALVLLAASVAGAGPVDLHREYDPTRPPRILTDPPVRSIADLPHLDTDPAPVETWLTFYQVRALPAPLLLTRIGGTVELHQAAMLGACCDYTGVCLDVTESECRSRHLANSWHGLGSSCSDTPDPCPAGSCCQGADVGPCRTASNHAACNYEGDGDFVPGATCDSSDPWTCSACCVTLGDCSIRHRVNCTADFAEGLDCWTAGCI